jgi:nicotinamide riboside kinase
MKIAFIGTHGIGKTTLTYELCTRLKKQDMDVGYIEELARRCPFPINEGTSLEAQTWILTMTIVKEIELSKIYKHTICDRSVLDNYAYLYNKFGHIPALYDLAKYWIRTYDLLVKVPINEQYLKADGVRSVNLSFQRVIDNRIDELLAETHTSYSPYSDMDSLVESIHRKSADSAG